MDPKSWIVIFMFFLASLFKSWFLSYDTMTLEYHIATTWDSRPVTHGGVTIRLSPHAAGVKMEAEGPFFDDPPNPGGTPGEVFPGLWDYEVAEAFFLSDDDKYLEVELCPHGQHLLLILKGYRDLFKDGLPLSYTAQINGARWHGEAILPASYFPPNVTKFNAYAIHGSGDNRTYESLFPVPEGAFENPDFHRLDYFKPINFSRLLPSNAADDYSSDVWEINHTAS